MSVRRRALPLKNAVKEKNSKKSKKNPSNKKKECVSPRTAAIGRLD